MTMLKNALLLAAMMISIACNAQNKVVKEEVFAEGWLDKDSQEVWGRPVDVLQLPDGSMLVSDDMSNCIYRISYKK